MTLARLLYASRSTLDEAPADGGEIVREIARASSISNRAADLTGCLLFVDGQFIQVIEGPLEQVEETFERICCDFRHCEVQLIDLQSVGSRLFQEWGMACLTDCETPTAGMRDEMLDVRFLVGLNAREAMQQIRTMLDTVQRTAAFAA